MRSLDPTQAHSTGQGDHLKRGMALCHLRFGQLSQGKPLHINLRDKNHSRIELVTTNKDLLVKSTSSITSKSSC